MAKDLKLYFSQDREVRTSMRNISHSSYVFLMIINIYMHYSTEPSLQVVIYLTLRFVANYVRVHIFDVHTLR